MRYHLTFFLALATGAAAACTNNQHDCLKNPQLSCYVGAAGAGGAGGAGGTTTGSTGTGAGFLADGMPCKYAGQCVHNRCVDGVCCETACDGPCEVCGEGGHCAALPAGTMDPKNSTCDALGGCGEAPGQCMCSDGVKNGDETDVDCGGPLCRRCGTGLACSSKGDCLSGFCADGYCCNAGCGGPCEACDAAEHPGLCLPVAQGTADPLCNAPQVCGTAGTCAKPLNEMCSSDSQCATNRCLITCLSCAQDVDCTNGKVCIQGACFEEADDGAPCPSDLACKSGRCVDGACCAVECNGPCMACHRNYTEVATGTCAPILSGHDPHDECSGPGSAAACNGAGKCGDP